MNTNQVWAPPFLQDFEYPSKSPSFKGVTLQLPRSGRGEIRVSKQVYPIWTIDYVLDHARGGEQLENSDYQYLLGFWIAMGGQLSSFLYLDPNDNTVTNVGFGLGDGTTTTFQLSRPIGIGSDIVQNLKGTPKIYVGGVAKTPSSIVNGLVTFATPPASGVLLTWTGSYYYRVRFADNATTFDQFMQMLWENKKFSLESLIL